MEEKPLHPETARKMAVYMVQLTRMHQDSHYYLIVFKAFYSLYPDIDAFATFVKTSVKLIESDIEREHLSESSERVISQKTNLSRHRSLLAEILKTSNELYQEDEKKG